MGTEEVGIDYFDVVFGKGYFTAYNPESATITKPTKHNMRSLVRITRFCHACIREKPSFCIVLTLHRIQIWTFQRRWAFFVACGELSMWSIYMEADRISWKC
jgi:hypothetical protein